MNVLVHIGFEILQYVDLHMLKLYETGELVSLLFAFSHKLAVAS